MRADAYEFFEPPFIAFAHRGGATYGPNEGRENSLHAFQQAVAMGYRYLETDVHATADGVLLAFHDDRLDRVTDRTGLIADMAYAQVKGARIGGIDPIPLFEDLLTAFPDARFNVDAKSPASVDLLADLVVKHDAYDRVCLTSFGIRRLHRLRRRLGHRVPTAASKLGIALNRFAPWLTRLVNTPAPALQIPVEYPIFGRSLRLFTPALVRAVHAAGKQVHIWTVDDSESMEELIDAGADGIFTDRIDTLKAVLQRRSLWSDADPGKPLLPRKRERSAEQRGVRGVVPPSDSDADPGKPLLPRKRERSAEQRGVRGVVPPSDSGTDPGSLQLPQEHARSAPQGPVRGVVPPADAAGPTPGRTPPAQPGATPEGTSPPGVEDRQSEDL